MYRLLNLRNCQNEIRVHPENPYAILDTEDATIAAITDTGHLIYCNRAFLLKYNIEHDGGYFPTICEALPRLWERFRKPPSESRDKAFKVVNLRLDASGRPLGHLLISFEKESSPLYHHHKKIKVIKEVEIIAF